MKKTQFMSAIASIEEVQTGNANNPLLTLVKFIFSDNQANSNSQGIDEEEFDPIIQSAINMPVKMQLAGGDVGGHDLSIPIGHIVEMEKVDDGDIKKLVASAVLYKQEFPEEVAFLKTAFESGDAPGISWELAYKESMLKDGIEWLKKVITAAATFVKEPAYGKRTALLAIASSAAASTDDEVMKRLEEIVSLWKKPEPKGGMTVDELEQAKKDLAEAQAKITKLETDLATSTAEVETLKTENTTLTRAALAADRTKKYTDAGFTLDTDDDKKAKKLEHWTSMSEEVFADYLAELVEIKEAATKGSASASASGGNLGLPRLGGEGTGVLALADLKIGLRNAARGITE